MSDDQTRQAPGTEAAPPAGDGAAAACADSVAVFSGYLIIDGCKVARVEPGGVIAFPDKCRERSQRRGSDQVRVRVTDLACAVQASEGDGEK